MENVVNAYKERIIGNIVSLTAAEGRDIFEIPMIVEEIQREFKSLSREDQDVLIKKFKKKKEQFQFLV